MNNYFLLNDTSYGPCLNFNVFSSGSNVSSTPASSSSADDTDNTLLIAAGIVGVAIIGAAVVMSRRKTDDPYAQQFPEPAAKPEPVEKKTFTPKKKKVTKTFKPKAELATIECPGCQAKMKVPKLGELQEVTCKECGLSGEIEI